MHVVSISRRTDIAAFYAPWLLGRLEAGYCRVPNPMSKVPFDVSLRAEDVLALAFWTKNPRPLLPHLDRIEQLGHRYYFQFTINPYDHIFESKVIPTDRAVAAFRELSTRLGPDLVVWRYDPIVETALTPWEWHVAQFRELCSSLKGLTRRCVFSFVQLYRRTRIRMDRLAVEHGFDYRFLNLKPEQGSYSRHGRAYEVEEMQARSRELAAIAAEAGMGLQTCCCDALIDEAHNITKSHCIDADLVALARGDDVRLAAKPTRTDCGCAVSRDIGVYETCPHGCGASYCYAVDNRDRALANRAAHDPAGEFLWWPYADPPPPSKASPSLPIAQLGLPF